MNPKKPRAVCRGCGQECGGPNARVTSIYCSQLCQKNAEYLGYIERWKAGQETGLRGVKTPMFSGHLYRYLREKKGEACWSCGWDAKHPVTGKCPLQIDHVDGNWQNNREDNLRLLCPNCHAMTPTFAGLNRGNGRTLRSTATSTPR